MPDSKIKAAVIGVGSLGAHHARIYSQLPDVELVAVVDERPDRAAAVAGRYGCQALNRPPDLPDAVEVVSLAVPTAVHGEVGVPLLRDGKHLLIEKPIAGSLADADLLIEARNGSGTVLHVGHSERFNPALTAARPLVTSPRFVEADRLGVFVARSLDIDVVLDLMIHDIDLLLLLSGREVVDIKPVGIPVLTPRVDIANARIEMDDGCVANITASRVSRDRVRKLRFFQPNDYISIDFQTRSVDVFSLREGPEIPEIVDRSPKVEDYEPLRAEIETFLAAVRGKPASAACSGEQGRKALSVALDIISGIA